MALLNPFGGAGAAPRKYEEAKTLLDLAHIDFTLKHTERRLHGYEILNKEVQVGQYDSVISISGDGLFHEMVNGLMQREDRD